MSTTSYSTVNPLDRRITLLRVELGTDTRYSLVETTLDHAESFFALSYPWGDQKNRKTITVDDQSVKVPTNLARALQDVTAFGKKRHSDRNELYLWTDQLCVTISDDCEKSHQVSLMGDIYRMAEQVLVWLPLGRDIRFGFRDWSEWEEFHRDQVTDRRRSSVPSVGKRVAMSYSAISQPARQEYPADSEGDEIVKAQLTAWDNVMSIVISPWWQRTWCHAEFLQATRTTFLMGGLHAPWEDLGPLLQLYEAQREIHSKFCTLTLNMLKHEEVTTRPSSGGGFCSCFGGGGDDSPTKDPNHVKDQRAYLRHHIQKLTDVSPFWEHVNTITTIKTDQEAQEKDQIVPLSNWLKHARKYKNSDPRDKVFAFLGLADALDLVHVDYSQFVRSVYTDAARAIILQEDRLDILATACESPAQIDSRLPSWVPDWSYKEDPESPYRQFLRQLQAPANRRSIGDAMTRASQASSPGVDFEAGGILRVTGVLVDKLEFLLSENEAQSVRVFQAGSRREVSTVKKAEKGDEVWMFLGADEVFTLRPQEDGTYRLLGHAMVREADGEVSDVMSGSLMDRVNKEDMFTSEIKIA